MRNATSAPSVRRLLAYLDGASRSRPASLSPTTGAPTGPGQARELAAELTGCAPSGSSSRAAAGAARDLVGQRRRRARVHGRRPVHRPERAAAAGCAAAVGAQRRGDRHPAGPRRPGGARARSARSSRAATTCCCTPTSAPGSPTRSAGSRRSAPTRPRSCCRDRGRRLVLRHRTAGAGGAGRASHPRGAGRLDRRPRHPGRHHRDRPADLSGIARMLRGFAFGAIPVQTLAAQLGSSRMSAAPGSLLRQAGPVHGHRRGQHVAYSCCTSRCAAVGAQAANLWPAADSRRQHRGEPPVHLRRLWAAGTPAHQMRGLSPSASRWRSPPAPWPPCTRWSASPLVRPNSPCS